MNEYRINLLSYSEFAVLVLPPQLLSKIYYVSVDASGLSYKAIIIKTVIMKVLSRDMSF